MPSATVVTHERRATWARHLRPRLAAAGTVRWVESRNGADLERAVRGTSASVVVIDVADRPRAMLEDLDRAAEACPSGLFLVLVPRAHPGVSALAFERGATLVMAGVVPPPRVAAMLLRWLPLARRRAEGSGWSPDGPDDATWPRLD
jgi:AmiR/NasT family two-component response regulator